MPKLFKIEFGLLFLSFSIFINSCGSGPEVHAVVVQKPISSIQLFLDNSESNMGYMNGPTKYKATVDELIADLASQKTTNGTKFNYISDSVYKVNLTDKQFIDVVSNNKIKPTKCSEMHQMMDMLTSKLDSFDIGILISDCILSYCDVEGNPNKNKDNAESQLKTSVKTAFRKLRDAGTCASVYAFKSAFTGRYFHYDNTPEQYTGEIRPFYIWFIGRKEQLSRLNLDLSNNSSFKPEAQLHFGFDSNPVNSFDLFFSTGKKGDYKINAKEINDIEIKPQKPIDFVMGVNLEKLPPYAQKTDYLKNNFTSNFAHLKLMDVVLKKDFQLKDQNNREKEMKENDTHFFYFEVDDLIKTTPAEIAIENKTDNWYESWSTMDDKNKQSNKEKTFALVHLINGINEAYEVKNNPFLKITLLLKK